MQIIAGRFHNYTHAFQLCECFRRPLLRGQFNGVTVYGTFELFGLPKTSVPLGSGYCVHDFRRFRIYEAAPNPKWTVPVSGKNAGATKPAAASG